jgi:hypothetical protein
MIIGPKLKGIRVSVEVGPGFVVGMIEGVSLGGDDEAG